MAYYTDEPPSWSRLRLARRFGWTERISRNPPHFSSCAPPCGKPAHGRSYHAVPEAGGPEEDDHGAARGGSFPARSCRQDI